MAAIQETGQNSYYLQDDLGSPMLLTDEQGQIRESYAFDEYGQALRHTPEDQLQPFGYTGYQMETTSGLYFAQARRYDAAAGRFTSEDKIPGLTTLPHTMNRYTYCWNQPLEHVDLNGRFPWVILPQIIDFAITIGRITYTIVQQVIDNINYPMPQPSGYEYKYTADVYNSDEYVERTNCYSYAFDVINNPVTGEQFYTREERKIYSKEFANQPGLFSGQRDIYNASFIKGDAEGNAKFVELIKDDAVVMGLNFQEYKEEMSGGYAVLLVIMPGRDYHWYRQEADGTWSHKPGSTQVKTGVINPIADARDRGYSSIVGYYYVSEACNE